MQLRELDYIPLEGKTYSLFGDQVSTSNYFNTISFLCDKIVERDSIPVVLETIQKYSSRKKDLKKLLQSKSDSLIAFCLKEITPHLKVYTRKTEEHLKNISSLKKITDRRLGTTEEQYHLYMLEIALTNRLYSDSFHKANKKISLQPYCLQDFSVSCKSSKNEFDYQCRHCSKNCYQNFVSRILKENGIDSYIWMGASLKRVAKEAYKNHQTFAVLGIACIPELVWGMRKCRKNGIPVIGLPLNANRCVRWFGEFHQNSVDLKEMEKLVKT